MANAEQNYFRRPITIALAACFITGAIAGWFVGQNFAALNGSSFHPLRLDNPTFKFINPLIGFDVDKKEFNDYAPLGKQLFQLVTQEKDAGHADDILVYFRDPTNGHWVGINEQEEYLPASLLKVPVMMAYFKEAESNPAVLSQMITYDGSGGNQTVSELEPHQLLTVGQSYTVDDLIQKMIVKSDNTSFYLLLATIDQKSLREVFSDIGIQFQDVTSPNYHISAKTYVRFFRELYNATFLNHEMSERALRLLSQTEFKDGLVASMPPSITVAHKYGEWVTRVQGAIVKIELHDCGIVYFPGHPYHLCVMTSGNNIQDLKTVIQRVSKLVYQAVAEVY